MIIRKAFPIESKAVDEAEGIFEIMITTEDQDRQGDFVRAAGGKIESYLRNPIVLFGHSYSDLPVARTLSLEIIPGRGIKAQFQFPPAGTYDKADVIHSLFAEKFINAASIGFIPVTAIPLDSKYPLGAQDYIEWELLEWSLVSVPANQDALRLALDNIEDTLTKRGRVLSAGNEKKLKEAADAINQVLSQLEDADPEPDESINTEHGEESNIDPTLNKEISPELLSKIETLLDTLFSVVEN